MGEKHIELDLSDPIWDRFFIVAPLVLVGTLEADGEPDLAPKHMVMPMGLQNFIGFVCTPRHGTYANISRSGEFTVSYPRPSQLVITSLAATPRCEDDIEKPVIGALPTEQARAIEGVVVSDAYLQIECRHYKTFDDFGVNSLITGEIVAARAHPDALRVSDGDDQAQIARAPLLCYIQPGRFASIADTQTFPFPRGMKK